MRSTVGNYRTENIVTRGLVLHLDAGNPNSYYGPSNSTVWKDLSGNGNNGTLVNGVGYNDGAFVFDGVNDYVNIPQNVDINVGSSDFSVSFWYKAGNWLDSRPLIYKGGNLTNNPGWMFRQISTGLQFVLRTSSATSAVTYTNTTVGVWTNIVGIFNIGVNTEIYANGVSSTQISNSLTSIANTLNLELGKGLDSSSPPAKTFYYTGRLNGIFIYNRALTPSEISQNFNAQRSRFGI